MTAPRLSPERLAEIQARLEAATPGECENCGAFAGVSRTGGFRRFCSRRCKDRAYSRNAGAAAALRRHKAFRQTERGKELSRQITRRAYRRHRDKALARAAVQTAMRAGVLSRPSVCSACQAFGRIEAHHVDYTQPLAVVWLCKRCHVAADREQREDAA